MATMKKIILLLSFFLFTITSLYSQNKHYEHIDSLLKSDLIESAVKYYSKNKSFFESKSHPASQIIYNDIIGLYLESYDKEDPYWKLEKWLNEVEKSNTDLEKSLRYFVMAKMLQSHYSNYRYKIANSTQTDAKDIHFWGTKTYQDTIFYFYSKALNYSEVLQKVKASSLIYFFDEDDNEDLELTKMNAYDILSLNYIQFLSNGEMVFDKIENKLSVDKGFLEPKVVKRNPNAGKEFQLLFDIFENTLSYYERTNNSKNMIHWDIIKCKFYSPYINGDYVLYEALINISKAYKDTKHGIYPLLLALELYIGNNDSHIYPLKITNSNEVLNSNKELYEYCKKLVLSDADQLIKFTAFEILEKLSIVNINLKIPSATLPNQATPVLVEYKNANKIKVSIYKADYKEYLNTLDGNTQLQNLVSEDSKIFSQTFEWKFEDDMKSHSTEIALPALPIGFYIYELEVFDVNNNSDQRKYFKNTVTQIAELDIKNYGINTNSLILVDRMNGEHLIPDQITVYDYKYNKNKYNLELIVKEKGTSGYIDMNKLLANVATNYYNDYFLEIKKGEDVYFIKYYYYNYQVEKHTQERVNVFTDRGVYRPGQKVYFKTIHVKEIEAETNNYHVVKDREITVYLHDANNQILDSLNVKSNEFGSASGEFTLPTNLLNGQFKLTVNKNSLGYKTFRVEEYKRPTYSVRMDELEDSYKLFDKITQTGFAEAYAGYGISNAEVKYVIKRNVRYPYFWKCYYLPTPTMKILSEGSTKTNAEGKFEIPLHLLPDESINKDLDPIFDFSIEITVIDENGETKVLNKSVSAAYQSTFVHISANDVVNTSDDSLRVTVKNINQKVLDRPIQIRIYKLEAREFKRKRRWDAPDKPLYSKEEFEALFPYDEYESEKSIFDRKKEKLVYEIKSISSNKSTWSYNQLPLDENGYYLIEAEHITSEGMTVLEKKYFHVYKDKNKGISEIPFITESNQNLVQPNDTWTMKVILPIKNITAHHFIENKKTLKTYFNTNTINYLINEEDRGGVYVNSFYVYNNTIEKKSTYIRVPYTNKTMSIKWLSHKGKVVPGSKETWSFEINGEDLNNVELLSMMYDATLDEIASNSYDFSTSLYPSTYSNSSLSESLMNNQGVNFYKHRFENLEKYENEISLTRYRPNYFRRTEEINFYGYMNEIMDDYYGNYMNIRHMEAPAPVSDSHGVPGSASGIQIRGTGSISGKNSPLYVVDGAIYNGDISMLNPKDLESTVVLKDASATSLYGSRGANGVVVITTKNNSNDAPNTDIQVRKNLNETAYFLPFIKQENGTFKVEFTFPESTTKWKMISLAHSKDMKLGSIEGFVQTQKEIMIQPNVPRFVRQGDEIVLAAKVVNLTEATVPLDAFIELFHPSTNELLHKQWLESERKYSIEILSKESKNVEWKIKVPEDYSGMLGIRYFADGNTFQDAVEYVLPVLQNKERITEAFPVYVNGSGNVSVNINTTSTTLQPKKLVVEYSANPMWYVLQSIPTFSKQDEVSAERIAYQLLLTSLALKIAEDNPDIVSKLKNMESVFNDDKESFESKLEQNQDLKKILLQETPWMMESESMASQIKELITLFDLPKLKFQKNKLITALFRLQNEDGGWSWYPGMQSNDYVTKNILKALMKIHQWQINDIREEPFKEAVKLAIEYVDVKFNEEIEKYFTSNPKEHYISYTFVDYMQLRWQLKDYFAISKNTEANIHKYFSAIKNKISKESPYQKAQMAILAFGLNEKELGKKWIESIRQSAIIKDELGMYWPEHREGYYWYNNSFIAHYYIMEAFRLYNVDEKYIHEMKKWILKKKQTQHWGDERNTIFALDALVIADNKWVSNVSDLSVTYNQKHISVDTFSTFKNWSYVRTTIDSGLSIPSNKSIEFTVTQRNQSTPSWGAVYWQYEERVENISFNPNTPFKVKKKYLIKDTNTSIETWKEWNSTITLKQGDILKVQLILESDRDMDFVHVKDYRPSSFEPKEFISRYFYKSGIGYYINIKDASVDFFIERMRKGTHIVEYDLKVESKGVYQSGIAEIQSYYAPEFRNVYPSVTLEVK